MIKNDPKTLLVHYTMIYMNKYLQKLNEVIFGRYKIKFSSKFKSSSFNDPRLKSIYWMTPTSSILTVQVKVLNLD